MEQSAVIKSKVEISRNLNGYLFPHKLSNREAEIIINKVKNILSNSEYDFTLHNISELSQNEINLLEERELLEYDFFESVNGALLFNQDKTICILLNGLNHIKIQVIGYNGIRELYKIADEIDDILNQNLEYAFDNDLGYLLTCPMDIGTGLKVTNTIHLPTISQTSEIKDYYDVARNIGVNFKGVYGKTRSILGNLYQISNSIMIGRSEENIIKSVESLSNDLTKNEYNHRELLKNIKEIDLKDKVFRALGTLTNARIIKNTELMECLSDVKLGIELGYIEDVSLEKVISLMIGKQPYISVISANNEEKTIERASYIRKEFNLANRNNR